MAEKRMEKMDELLAELSQLTGKNSYVINDEIMYQSDIDGSEQRLLVDNTLTRKIYKLLVR